MQKKWAKKWKKRLRETCNSTENPLFLKEIRGFHMLKNVVMYVCMSSVFGTIFYILIFLSVYVQVFFLVTFFENRKRIISRKGDLKLADYPGVTVIVPCWNEEKTLKNTVESLLGLNYPKDKLSIFLVDDGSKDSTWEVMSLFAKYENVKIFRKENGGKHTALNLGLKNTQTPYVGCLDADSFADPQSLLRIMSYFEKDKNIMAVAPSIIVHNPKTLVQSAQSAEYYMSVYLKKMLGFMGAIHVTPGPLTIFKKQVFDDLGPYRHAHNTEDMEIAYRMQKHGYKIEQCNDAYVYTNTPRTVKTLYKQRLRWIYGFLNNTIDYRSVLFKPKYGNFSLFTVPSGLISVLAVGYIFGKSIYGIGEFIYQKIVHVQTIGFHFNFVPKFDFFFINTNALLFVTIALYSMVLFSVFAGYKIAKEKWSFSLDMAYFFIIYSIIAPFWLLRAVYNTAISKKPSWR